MPTSTAPEPGLSAAPSSRRRWSRLDLLTALLLGVSLLGAAAMARWRGQVLHGNDFKHLWLGARLLSLGRSPYDAKLFLDAARRSGLDGINPFVYLPTTGLLLRPLAELGFGAAQLTWFWLNWLLAWGVVLGGPGLLRVARPAAARLAGAAFLAGAMPFYRQQTAGQMNVVTAALILIAAAGLVRKKDGLAGGALAVGFGWKIAPALLIGALAGLRRGRALAWGCAGCLAVAAVSAGVYGVEMNRAALAVTRQMGYGSSTWAERGDDFYRDPFNQSINSLMHHLVTANPYTRPWVAGPARLANGLTVFCSILIAGLWIAQAARRVWGVGKKKSWSGGGEEHGREGARNPQPASRTPQPVLPLFLAASLAMLLLPSLMWDHYAVQALPALLWVFGQRPTTRSPWRGALAVAILGTLTLPVAAPAWNHGAGILVMSLRLWPTLALYGWLLLDGRLGEPERPVRS